MLLCRQSSVTWDILAHWVETSVTYDRSTDSEQRATSATTRPSHVRLSNTCPSYTTHRPRHDVRLTYDSPTLVLHTRHIDHDTTVSRTTLRHSSFIHNTSTTTRPSHVRLSDTRPSYTTHRPRHDVRLTYDSPTLVLHIRHIDHDTTVSRTTHNNCCMLQSVLKRRLSVTTTALSKCN